MWWSIAIVVVVIAVAAASVHVIEVVVVHVGVAAGAGAAVHVGVLVGTAMCSRFAFAERVMIAPATGLTPVLREVSTPTPAATTYTSPPGARLSVVSHGGSFLVPSLKVIEVLRCPPAPSGVTTPTVGWIAAVEVMRMGILTKILVVRMMMIILMVVVTAVAAILMIVPSLIAIPSRCCCCSSSPASGGSSQRGIIIGIIMIMMMVVIAGLLRRWIAVHVYKIMIIVIK